MLSYDAENYVVDVISFIGEYLWRSGYVSGDPTENTGAEYENEVFLISAYDWNDEREEYLPNFWYKPGNYQLEWYDHLGRGTFANTYIDVYEAMNILETCINSIDGDGQPRFDPPDFEWKYQEPDDED